ncbi:phosphoadenosine phosphosulfate reductase family protein (plasmid) [Alteromonas macleodii]|uniref:phosphoadenosine phosphosulfate reductase family protein n=1 Tax=Alteromonas macleodii TaxID=28108 RepID=UPI0030CE49A0
MEKVHVVSFSGGRTSAYLVYLMEQMRIQYGWEVYYVFFYTGAEHPKTYQFIQDVVEHFGIDLICLRPVINPKMNVGVTYRVVEMEELKADLQPWKDMVAKYGLPTINAPRCTSRMKTEPHDKYCDQRWGKGNYATWLGIRIDEPKRLKHYGVTLDMFNDKSPVRPIRYLAEISGFTKQDVLDWWSEQAFDLDLPEHLGNCVFCIKKHEMKLVAAAQQEPKLAKEFHAMLTDDDVRVLPGQPFEGDVIYRGHLSMTGIVKLSSQLPKESVLASIADKQLFEETEPSLCSESCEVFPDPDDFELEMEEEAA